MIYLDSRFWMKFQTEILKYVKSRDLNKEDFTIQWIPTFYVSLWGSNFHSKIWYHCSCQWRRNIAYVFVWFHYQLHYEYFACRNLRISVQPISVILCSKQFTKAAYCVKHWMWLAGCTFRELNILRNYSIDSTQTFRNLVASRKNSCNWIYLFKHFSEFHPSSCAVFLPFPTLIAHGSE